MQLTEIDLRLALEHGLRQVLISVDNLGLSQANPGGYASPRNHFDVIVQITNLNVTSIKLDDAVRVFGVDRISGKLRKDANFSLIPKEVSAVPSSDYVTDLVGKRLTIGRVVVGRSENDESVTVASGNWFNPMPPPSKYQWYVYTIGKSADLR